MVPLDRTTFELREEMAAHACPVCTLVKRSLFRWADNLLYEQVNDFETAQQIAQSLGFCPTHSAYLVSLGDALGLAIIAERALRRLDREGMTPPAASKPAAWRRFAPQRRVTRRAVTPCLACQVCDDATARVITAFVAGLQNDAAFAQAWAGSKGLCHRHMRQALEAGADPKQVLPVQQRVLTELLNDLEQFIRLGDYHHQGEPYGQAADAWKRAFRFLGGEDPVVFTCGLI